jgi:hypothetical protein
MAPQPEGTEARFITIMCTPGEEAEITRAAAMHPGPDGAPAPVTVSEYLLGLHREHMARLRGLA